MKMTEEDNQQYNTATICYICEKDLGEDKVRDHCHFTGKFRGAVHNSCSLQCRKPVVLPVIFYNLRGYDAHLFIKQLSKIKGVLNCIPSTEEKCISFAKEIQVDEYFSRKRNQQIKLNFERRLIDSFKFFQTSLANLASNLQQDDFINTGKIIKNNIELLTIKGVYSYEYVFLSQNSLKHNFHQSQRFIQSLMMIIFLKKIINTRKMFGKHSTVKLSKIITISISSQMFFFLLMFSERLQ